MHTHYPSSTPEMLKLAVTLMPNVRPDTLEEAFKVAIANIKPEHGDYYDVQAAVIELSCIAAIAEVIQAPTGEVVCELLAMTWNFFHHLSPEGADEMASLLSFARGAAHELGIRWDLKHVEGFEFPSDQAAAMDFSFGCGYIAGRADAINQDTDGDEALASMDAATVELAAERLHAYVRTRAGAEGVAYTLSPTLYAEGLREGVRKFFGVGVSDDGRLEFDEQQPRKDYFADYNLTQQKQMH